MMRKLLIAMLMLLSGMSYGQMELTRIYYDERGKELPDESGSLYMTVGKKDQKGYWRDTVRSYYTKSSQLRSVEVFGDYGSRNGVQKNYFENGALKNQTRFEKGRIVGLSSGYYENTTPHYRYKYPKQFDGQNHFDEQMVVDYWDSTGTQLVKDGNGTCRCFVPILGEPYKQEGKLVDTLRVGEWLMFKNDSLVFREQYEAGKLTSGIRYAKTGEVKYQENTKLPEPVHGMEDLYRWISKTVRFPSEARRGHYEGTVFVAFVVAKDGSLEDIRTIKGVHSSLDNESERVIRLMQPWTPGSFKGQPLRVKYVLPVKFKMGY